MKLIGVLAILVSGLWSSAAWSEESLIAVTGLAEKSIDPNMVKIQLEVWGKSPQAKIAQESAAHEYQRVKALVEKYKIKKEDFETTSYNLVPEYNYDKGTSRIVGHRASHSILINLRKTEEAGAFVDALTSSSKSNMSAVSVQSLTWDYDKKSQIEMALLADAVKDARSQADELAKASGTKIKRVYRLSRIVAGGSFVPSGRSSKFMGQEAALASTEMAAGPVKIQVYVAAEYEIQ